MTANHSNVIEIVNAVRESGASRALIQVPAGLKTRAVEIAEAVEKEGTEAVISARPSYGACDLADREAKKAGCDVLVHIGHSRFYRDFKTDVPVIYYPWKYEINLECDFSTIREKRIGLLTTINHADSIGIVSALLEKSGKEPVIGGQVLGCWFENAAKIEDKVDAFLFVCSGLFHPTGLRTEKPLYVLDAERNEISSINVMPLEKRRYANIYNAKDAEIFAILVSAKEGQRNLLADAGEIKKRLRQKDKKAFIVIMDEINDASLQGIRADAYINTACPRLAGDTFSKPFVNAADIGLVLDVEKAAVI